MSSRYDVECNARPKCLRCQGHVLNIVVQAFLFLPERRNVRHSHTMGRSFPIVGHIQPSPTPPASINNTTLARNSMTGMAPIDEAVAFLKSSDEPNISEAARMFKIERSTVSKHFRGKRGSIAKANETKQLLTKTQEIVLVNHIKRLCDWCLPPTPEIVATCAKELCG